MEQTRKRILRTVLLVMLVLVFLLLQYGSDVAPLLRPEAVGAWLERLGIWAPVVYMGVMALVVVTPLPSLPLNFAAGVYFGPMLGTLFSVAGATAGATISFLIARVLGRELVEGHLQGHILLCRDCTDRLLSKIVLLGRLIPLISFDMISYSAGLTQMSVRSFVAANFVGMLPLTFAYNYFGSAVTIGSGWTVALSVVFVVLLFFLPRWIERYDLFGLRRFMVHRHENNEDRTGQKGS